MGAGVVWYGALEVEVECTADVWIVVWPGVVVYVRLAVVTVDDELAVLKATNTVVGGGVVAVLPKQLPVQQSPQAAQTSRFSDSSSGDPGGADIGHALHDVCPAGQA